ncbi:MAG TPA: phage holin family protein [Candidatus Stackebrandtia excrementipullorum]|nr:phage holin family protein [Candidatus Stackebrandtia excrementipullorum]
MSFLLKTITTAAALWVTTLLFSPHIDTTAQTTSGHIGTLLAVAIIFGLVNAIVKPIVKVIGCALYAISLGLFALVVNALLFLLVDYIADTLDIPFHVDGFWWAMLGAVVVAIVSWILNLVIPDKEKK